MTKKQEKIKRKNKFEAKKERVLKYAHELYEESLKKNKGVSFTRMDFVSNLHPYECDIQTCPLLMEHIWYDLQVIKSKLL